MKTTIMVTRRFYLEGKRLRVEETKKIYNIIKKTKRYIVKEFLREEKKLENFNLIEVKPEVLSKYRKKKIPIFILKTDGELYFSVVPRELNLISTKFMGKHQCAYDRCTCRRLLCTTNDNGGCEKVRNFSKYIEKYPWITRGYETCNTDQEALVVIECQHKC